MPSRKVDGWVIDSGCVFSAAELMRELADKPLAGIVNTHSHEDHIGANGRLQRERAGLTIRAHPLALSALADPQGQQRLHPYRRMLWGWPEPSHSRPVSDGEAIETGRYRFRVIYTPGHSHDHICLYEPERGWLFIGGLFVGGQDRTLGHFSRRWLVLSYLKAGG